MDRARVIVGRCAVFWIASRRPLVRLRGCGDGLGHSHGSAAGGDARPGTAMFYLVGTPKGRVHQREKKWLDLPWQQVRAVDVPFIISSAIAWKRMSW
ncbi:MAG TPA: hypothetical protein VF772_15040 [Terriglobales bacterium]